MINHLKIDPKIPGDYQQIEAAKELGGNFLWTDEAASTIFEGTLLRDR
jgi:hypothetical protein